jgi:hypothetical protein
VVFYLNGQEIHRHNMPTGAVTANLLASAGAEATWVSVPDQRSSLALRAGPNRLSVEVHQESDNSSDIVFGINFDLATNPNGSASSETAFRINEMSLAGEILFWVELKNVSSSAFDPNGLLLSISVDPEREKVVESLSTIPAGGYLVVSFEDMAVADDDRIFLYTADRNRVLDAQAASKSLRGRSESGEWLDQWLFPSEASPGEPNQFIHEDAIVINEIMYHHQLEPAIRVADAPLITEAVFGMDQTWRYDQSGDDPGADWAGSSHDVWPTG